jgi:hypothetical protein
VTALTYHVLSLVGLGKAVLQGVDKGVVNFDLRQVEGEALIEFKGTIFITVSERHPEYLLCAVGI